MCGRGFSPGFLEAVGGVMVASWEWLFFPFVRAAIWELCS